MRVKSLEAACTVACGYAHTLVASVDGSVLGFGWNCHNQVLGAAEIGSNNDCLFPVVCLEKQLIVKISCGFAHSAAITSIGGFYTWGRLMHHCKCLTTNIHQSLCISLLRHE
jgi:alpha-tubulin suppressor-like RCC1 family protein